MSSRGKIAVLPLIGGHPGLDLVNTIEGAGEAGAIEHLHGPADLNIWLGRAVGQDVGPDADEAAFHSALRMRDLLRRLLAQRTDGLRLSPGDLAEAAAICKSSYGMRSLSVQGDRLDWSAPEAPAEARLTHLFRDTVELLTGPADPLIRKCPGDICGWFFIDTSRNRSRRWCTMEFCGNRAKVRRFRTPD